MDSQYSITEQSGQLGTHGVHSAVIGNIEGNEHTTGESDLTLGEVEFRDVLM